jgi:hypothetical protein
MDMLKKANEINQYTMQNSKEKLKEPIEEERLGHTTFE